MKYLFLSLLLIGCAHPRGEVIKMDDGIIFKANKNCVIKYQDKDVTAEFDSKSQPLVNLNLPNVEIEK